MLHYEIESQIFVQNFRVTMFKTKCICTHSGISEKINSRRNGRLENSFRRIFLSVAAR